MLCSHSLRIQLCQGFYIFIHVKFRSRTPRPKWCKYCQRWQPTVMSKHFYRCLRTWQFARTGRVKTGRDCWRSYSLGRLNEPTSPCHLRPAWGFLRSVRPSASMIGSTNPASEPKPPNYPLSFNIGYWTPPPYILTACSPPPYSLSAPERVAGGKSSWKEPVNTPSYWPRTAGEMVSHLKLVLTPSLTCITRWQKAVRSPKTSARTTVWSIAGLLLYVRVVKGKETQPHPLPHFIIRNGLLYCVAQCRGEEKTLLVVPRTKTETVLELAHLHMLASHLGAANTTQQIRGRFHWPGMEAEVKRFCQSCPTCQKTSQRTPPPSPLIPLPVIEVPFERIGMDLVGPLSKFARGHEHILVIVDYATRYPEAVPLRKATAKSIAHELFLLSSREGIPTEILTDQGTPFMSRLMADLCTLFKVKQLRTSVYHPQTDGLVERLNQMLKQMLRCVAAKDKRDWDLMLPYVLFGIWDVPQASTGFTPLELLVGRQPRGLLDVAREAWEQQLTPHRSVIEHIKEMRERIDRVMPLVREHLTKAQQGQQRHFNQAAQPREFQPGDRVMVLVPNSACKFLASWQGPYTSPRRSVPSPTGSASWDSGGQTSYITSTCWRNGWGQGASSPPSPLWTQWLWTSDYSCRRFRKPSFSLRPLGGLRSTTRSARHQEPS